MNLISDRWIPVRRADGSRQQIAPWELTDAIHDNPILAIASPRPDFDGALTQFLIGLLQTTCTPDAFTWRSWRKTPPPTDELRARFETIAHAFEIEGDIAFMQDFTPAELDKTFAISALLIGAPPEDSETDLFIKQGSIKQLCPRCAATALLSLQTDSPEGGRGYRTGLRGGGPLTTLVLGQHLWETCWLNVLEQSRYCEDLSEQPQATHARFPWCASTRTSEAKPPAGVTTPVDVHPDQQFWPLPRRIRLTAEDADQAVCDICASTTQRVYRSFKTKNYGVNYDGFQHPLSPYYSKDNTLFAAHPRPGGIGYRHWLGLVENSADGSHRAARVVNQYRISTRSDGDLWAFGYDMKSNKARCWYDTRMPIISAPEEIEDLFRDLVTRLVSAADKVADDLRSSLKQALFGEAKVRGDLSFVQGALWSMTEGPFYAHVRTLRDQLPTDPQAHPILECWLKTIREAAFEAFDRHSQTGDFDAVDPRQIAMARNALGKALAGAPLKQKILGLPKPRKKKRQPS